MTTTEPVTSPGESRPRGGWLRAILPHAITAVIAIAAAVGIQLLLARPAPAVIVPPATMVPSIAPSAQQPAPTIAAQATAPPLAAGISEQELADVRAESDRKQAQIYLLMAIVQMDDAQAALRMNELASVDQSLVAIDNSLSLAYQRYDSAADSARDAVAQRRIEVGKMHDDLYLYPEGMDQRLDTLRQLTLALITQQ